MAENQQPGKCAPALRACLKSLEHASRLWEVRMVGSILVPFKDNLVANAFGLKH
jgi:hypothetical protein